MKIGDKDYQVHGIKAGVATRADPDYPRQARVLLQVKVWGICMAEEEATPAEARQLARMLEEAADQAEGRVS